MGQAEIHRLEVSRLYDRLSRWAWWKSRIIAWRTGVAPMAMHKRMNPSVDDMALKAANLPPDAKVLDAGCGLGATVFYWVEKAGGKYLGVTLSKVEADLATREAERRRVSSHCSFVCGTFDESPGGDYDAVVAIESLIHSHNLSLTIAHLSRTLKPGGKLVMIDDVLRNGAHDIHDRGIERLREFWHLTNTPTEKAIREAFRLGHLEIVQERDLTANIRWKGPRFLPWKEGMLRIIQLLVPVGWIRGISQAYRGGVALQRLYRDGKARYMMFVGEKGNRFSGLS